MHINVWGPLRVAHDGRVLGPRDFSGAKPKQLLEILVAERGHAVSKSRLADLLWADRLPPKYLATLETYVSVLRQTLEPGVRARDSVVLTERGGYRLDTDRTTVDLEEFDLLVRSAAAQEPAEALSALTAALLLVRGHVLEDEPDAFWADRLRAVYVQKHLHVLIDTSRLLLATDAPTAALALAEQALLISPLAEAACRVVMSAAYRLGRQEQALLAFDRCRRRLCNELGVDPMAETVALHLTILRHEQVTTVVARPPAPVARATGPLDEAVAQALEGRFALLLQVLSESGVDQTRLTRELVERVGVFVGTDRRAALRPVPLAAVPAIDRQQAAQLAGSVPGRAVAHLLGRDRDIEAATLLLIPAQAGPGRRSTDVAAQRPRAAQSAP